MALIVLHLKGRGDPADNSDFCPFDIVTGVEDGASVGVRVSQIEWLAAGNPIEKFPGSFGVVQVLESLADLPVLDEPDREIQYIPKARRLTVAEKSTIENPRRDKKLAELRAPIGSIVVKSLASDLAIGTGAIDEAWIVKTAEQKNDEAIDVSFYDSADGRQIDFDLKQVFVRRRRRRIALTPIELNSILAGELPLIDAARIADKRAVI